MNSKSNLLENLFLKPKVLEPPNRRLGCQLRWQGGFAALGLRPKRHTFSAAETANGLFEPLNRLPHSALTDSPQASLGARPKGDSARGEGSLRDPEETPVGGRRGVEGGHPPRAPPERLTEFTRSRHEAKPDKAEELKWPGQKGPRIEALLGHFSSKPWHWAKGSLFNWPESGRPEE